VTKSELLNWLQGEHRQWKAFLDQIGMERMDEPGVAEDWSIKDIVAHLTGWQRRLNGSVQAAQRGEPEPPPPWPAHLQNEDEINAWIYDSNRGRSVREVLDESHQVLQQYIAIIEGLPDDVPIQSMWHLVWLGDQRFPAGEFFDHFHDDHEPDVRAWLARVDNRYSMIGSWRTSIWQQFGAAIDTLENAIRACPDGLWRGRLWNDPAERPEYTEFWFLSYHTLKWLDLYLNGTAEGFTLPARLQRYEKDSDGLPKTPYTKDDLLAYLVDCRRKCQMTIEALTDETAQQVCYFEWIGVEFSFAELLLYTMRHVQEHAAQLNLFLGQAHIPVDDSVPRAENKTA
jgi:hypothetical protein